MFSQTQFQFWKILNTFSFCPFSDKLLLPEKISGLCLRINLSCNEDLSKYTNILTELEKSLPDTAVDVAYTDVC